jgi:hypothetical protein
MATTVTDSARRAEPLRQRRTLARVDRLLIGWRLFLVVGAVYLAYGLFVTWPLATNLSGQLSAPNLLEDAAGSTSYFAVLAAHHLNPFLPGHLSVLNAPYGVSTTWALNLAQAPSYLLFWLLTLLFGAVAGANVFMLLGFVLSGTVMFAIVHRLFGSRLVALLAGFAFAFYPFAVAASSVHYVFVHGWPLLLCVWRLIEMIHQPTRRNALIAGVATAFAMWWNPYYELLGGFAFATCIVVCFAFGRARNARREALRACATAVLPVAVLGVFFAVLLKLGSAQSSIGALSRPISQVYTFSAHLRDYLLPGPYNPLFGNLTGAYLRAHLGGSGDLWESALYPGYVVIALALAGFVLAIRRLRAAPAALADIRVVAVLTSGALAAVAFVSSGPPSVSLLGVQITLPSGALFQITPTWQTFARFVILLELALIIMMAAALAQLRRSLPARKVGLVFALIGLLLVVDLWAREPKRTTSTTPPSAYAWLRAHQGGTVADYPILPAYDPATASSLFWGAYDRHPLFQGYAALSTIESMKLDLADLGGPATAGKLAGYGVRYIVVHRGTPGGGYASLRAQGYRPIVISRHGASLWQVPSATSATTVDARSGFSWYAGFPTYDTRLLQGAGVLAVHARNCSACVGTVSFFISGADRAVSVTVRDARTGAVLAQLEAPRKQSVRVSIPNVGLRDGSAELQLRPTPSNADAVVGMRTARLTLQSA